MGERGPIITYGPTTYIPAGVSRANNCMQVFVGSQD